MTSGSVGYNFEIQLYFETADNLSGTVIADTSTTPTIIGSETNAEWEFHALFTVRSTGANGTLWCDGQIMSTIRTDLDANAGLFTTRALDTTSNNFIELTASVTGGAGSADLYLEQCIIEYLATP